MKINSGIFNNIEISYYKNIYSNSSDRISVSKVLDYIKSETLNEQILAIRVAKLEHKDTVQKLKCCLPAVTFSGIFNPHRRIECCKCYSKLLIVDIDDLEEPLLTDCYNKLKNDVHVAALWISPSGNGVKCIVSLHITVDLEQVSYSVIHKYFFRLVLSYMLQKYGFIIDKSGSDISRLCFLTSDIHLFIKNEFESFELDTNIIKALDYEVVSNDQTSNVISVH